MSALRHAALPILLLTAAIWLVFWPATQARFVGWDDPDMVFQNPGLNPPSGKTVAEFWRRPYMRLYMPLAYTTWAAVAAAEDVAPGQPLDARAFHLLNLLLHTAAAGFVFLLLGELTGRVWPAWAGAMLFALHPLQVEPVAWVAGMNNLLCGALALAALWQYVRYVKTGGKWKFALATVLYGAALLSKPTAVVVPLMAMVLDVSVLHRRLKVSARALIVWLAMAAVMGVVAREAQPLIPMQSPPPVARLGVAVDAIGFYGGKLIAPINETFDYERSPRWLAQHAGAGWPGVAVLLLAGMVCLMRRTQWARAPLAVAILALLPVLGLMPFDFQDYSTVADRYMYLAMFGVALLAAGAMMRVKGMVPWTLALAALLLLGLRSFDQTGVWHDTPALIGRQLAFDPGSSSGHKIQAVWFMAEDRYDEAEDEFRAAIAALEREGKRGDGAVWSEYGNMLWKEGRTTEAIGLYEQAIGHMPPDRVGMAYDNLGLAYVASGNFSAAREQFVNALKVQPDDANAKKYVERLDAMNRR